jgi:hypothetical protein
VLLGIPLNGVDPQLRPLGTKSGSRRIFREAGVAFPDGAEDLHSQEDVAEALVALKSRRPDARRAVVKLNEGFSGGGNAVFRYPEAAGRPAVREAFAALSFSEPAETPECYFAKFPAMGGIVEELVEGEQTSSPRAQLRIDRRGGHLLSTHDQILGGPTEQRYLGCRFPAADAYRTNLQRSARRIGEVLAHKGVVSRFGVDFLARRRQGARTSTSSPSRSTCASAARRIRSSRSVPDGRPSRRRDRPLPLAERPAQVLPVDRQFEV